MKAGRMVRLAALFALLVQPGLIASAEACSCGSKPTPREALAEADAVFVGKVVRMEEKEFFVDFEGKPTALQNYAVTFDVLRSIKGGAAAKRQTVLTGLGGGDCGYPFEVDREYLVFASGPSGRLMTDMCTRTRPASVTDREILELESRLPVPKDAEKSPTVIMKGFVDDGGYKGYVFTLRNSLHDRIVFRDPSQIGFLVEIRVDGQWVPAAAIHPGMRSGVEASTDPTKATEWLRSFFESPVEFAYAHVGSFETMPNFVPAQSAAHEWRIGIPYVVEDDFLRDRLVPPSSTILWSEPVGPGAGAKRLSFKEAFSE